jgi:hypothetical protein
MEERASSHVGEPMGGLGWGERAHERRGRQPGESQKSGKGEGDGAPTEVNHRTLLGLSTPEACHLRIRDEGARQRSVTPRPLLGICSSRVRDCSDDVLPGHRQSPHLPSRHGRTTPPRGAAPLGGDGPSSAPPCYPASRHARCRLILDIPAPATPEPQALGPIDCPVTPDTPTSPADPHTPPQPPHPAPVRPHLRTWRSFRTRSLLARPLPGRGPRPFRAVASSWCCGASTAVFGGTILWVRAECAAHPCGWRRAPPSRSGRRRLRARGRLVRGQDRRATVRPDSWQPAAEPRRELVVGGRVRGWCRGYTPHTRSTKRGRPACRPWSPT